MVLTFRRCSACGRGACSSRWSPRESVALPAGAGTSAGRTILADRDLPPFPRRLGMAMRCDRQICANPRASRCDRRDQSRGKSRQDSAHMDGTSRLHHDRSSGSYWRGRGGDGRVHRRRPRQRSDHKGRAAGENIVPSRRRGSGRRIVAERGSGLNEAAIALALRQDSPSYKFISARVWRS